MKSWSEYTSGYKGGYGFDWGWLQMSGNYQGDSKTTSMSQSLYSVMRIERYYSSLREEISPLADDAATLLAEEDYVGFFKACGPNYIRGIRRTQEVMAVLRFSTSSRQSASEYSYAIQSSSWKSNAQGKSKYRSSNKSLTIKIKGYGLGLSQEGSETLVATSIAEYKAVMKFAYKTMTQADDSFHIGMVYGIELAPWVHNVEFQNAAKLQDADIITPMPRSLIPRAYHQDSTKPNAVWTTDEHHQRVFRCKDIATKIDKYGYCCEEEQMWDVSKGEYRTVGNFERSTSVCRPTRTLTPTVIKDNMANNGEFVARLDSAMRYKLNFMGTLEKCISSANSIPDEFLDNKLEPLNTVKHERVGDISVSLRQLKLAIDPQGNYTMLKHMGDELDEWIDMYYTPCFAALYGMNVGQTPDTDANYFMAYPWFSHPECMRLSCLSPNFRWDRNAGGCVAGLVNGAHAAAYTAGADTHCSKDPEETAGSSEVCKHKQTDLTSFKSKVDTCKAQNPASTSVFYMVTNYCMPDVTTTKVTRVQAAVDLYWACRGKTVPTSGASRRLSREEKPNKEKDATVPLPSLSEDKAFVSSLRMKIESME